MSLILALSGKFASPTKIPILNRNIYLKWFHYNNQINDENLWLFNSVQVSPWTSRPFGEGRGNKDVSAEILFQPFFFFFCRKPLWIVLAWGGTPLWCCLSRFSSANRHVPNSPKSPNVANFGNNVVACDMPEPCQYSLSAVARRGFCTPTRELILFRTSSLVSCSKEKMQKSFLRHFD